jgi:hypothetical protein
MADNGDKATALLMLLKGVQDAPGLKVVKVNTTEPNPYTFVFMVAL